MRRSSLATFAAASLLCFARPVSSGAVSGCLTFCAGGTHTLGLGAAMRLSGGGSSGSAVVRKRGGKTKLAAETQINKDAVAFTLASWNLDGISNDGLFPVQRAAKAAGVLLETQQGKLPHPDVIALQEVTQDTIRVIEKRFKAGGYVDTEQESVPPWPYSGYFTKCYVRRDSPWRCTAASRVPFRTSMMTRDLLTLSLSGPLGLSARVATAHLESTASQQEERLRQFNAATQAVTGAPAPPLCVLIGDLNIGTKDQVCLRATARQAAFCTLPSP